MGWNKSGHRTKMASLVSRPFVSYFMSLFMELRSRRRPRRGSAYSCGQARSAIISYGIDLLLLCPCSDDTIYNLDRCGCTLFLDLRRDCLLHLVIFILSA